MCGAGTDDKTSYHPRFDFEGKIRGDRPPNLFFFKKPARKCSDHPVPYLAWNGRVVLDYKGDPVRQFDLPLTISSEIGHEEARLESMLRSDPRIQWNDILARILRRGNTSAEALKFRNKLNISLGRWRAQARLVSFTSRLGSKSLEGYQLTLMTAEMVSKNTTQGLTDLDSESDESSFIKTLNLGTKAVNSRSEGGKAPEAERRLRSQIERAEKWARAQVDWEERNPAPAPSIYGETHCDDIQSIIAFKLASVNQYRYDGSLAFTGGFTLQSAPPSYQFNNQRMDAFFGNPACYPADTFTLPDVHDRYGLLNSPSITEAQTCLVDFLLEPARMQYPLLTLDEDRSDKYRPIFATNPNDSYWQQLQMLQSAFD